MSGISIKDKAPEWLKVNPKDRHFERILVENVNYSEFQFAVTIAYPGIGPHVPHVVWQNRAVTL